MTTRNAGISAALQAGDLMARTKSEAQAVVNDLHLQMEVALREHIGDVEPKGAPQFSFDGPVNDPLQGAIFVLTLQVPVETDDLPADCTAYAAMHGADLTATLEQRATRDDFSTED